jgi:threonine dehydratase
MTAVKESNPKIKVFGVEPAGAAKMRAALDAGKVVTLAEVKTIADGLKPTRVSQLTLDHVGRYADDVVSVTHKSGFATAR